MRGGAACKGEMSGKQKRRDTVVAVHYHKNGRKIHPPKKSWGLSFIWLYFYYEIPTIRYLRQLIFP